MAKEKPILALDLDDTILKLHPHMREFGERHLGIPTKYRDWDTYDLRRVWGIDDQQVGAALEALYRSGIYGHLKPVKNSPEVVNALAEKYRVIAITSRSRETETETWITLNAHFPGVFEAVHFSVVGDSVIHVPKSEICLREGVDTIIEDAHHQAHSCAEAGINAILMNRRWNRGLPLDPNLPIQRAGSWNTVRKLLLSK